MQHHHNHTPHFPSSRTHPFSLIKTRWQTLFRQTSATCYADQTCQARDPRLHLPGCRKTRNKCRDMQHEKQNSLARHRFPLDVDVNGSEWCCTRQTYPKSVLLLWPRTRTLARAMNDRQTGWTRRAESALHKNNGQKTSKVSTRVLLSTQSSSYSGGKSTCSLAPPQHQGPAQGPAMATRDTQDVGIKTC